MFRHVFAHGESAAVRRQIRKRLISQIFSVSIVVTRFLREEMIDRPSGAVKSVVRSLDRGAEEKRSLGDRIRAFRRHLGVTQEGLAELMGDVCRATVNRWEQGHPPNYQHFDRMLEVARDRGGLRLLVGTDEREIMQARFRLLNPSKGGVAVLIDFAVNEPGDLALILADICYIGVNPQSFVALGDEPKTEALVLVEAPDFARAEAISRHLGESDRVRDPHVLIGTPHTREHALGITSPGARDR